jgi:hypothetical protein
VKSKPERVAELARRAERQRLDLAENLEVVAVRARRHRTRWKVAGMTATGLAAAGTAAYRLFGKSSPAARIGRAASATSILLGLGKALLRVRKFL